MKVIFFILLSVSLGAFGQEGIFPEEAPALEPYRNYMPHTESVKSVRLSGNDSLLASGSFDSTACLWNFNSGELIRRIMFLSQLQDKGELCHKIADNQPDHRDLNKE